MRLNAELLPSQCTP